MAFPIRSSLRLVLGSVLAGVGAQSAAGCGESSCPGVPEGYRPRFTDWTTEVSSQTLIANGLESGNASGAVCEELCGNGRYFYDNSCRLAFDPRALDSAEAAEELRQKGQALEAGEGGARGEGGALNEGGSSGDISYGGTPASVGGAVVGGSEVGGLTAIGGVPTGIGAGGGMQNPSTWSVLVSCSGVAEYPCEGRRHISWGIRERCETGSPVGAWFARAARTEASSVRSFRALAMELRRTPLARKFSTRLRKAARDEIRHARLMDVEARHHGARRERQEFSPLVEGRTLRDIALENAREGCVFETYAALEMHWLAAHAASPERRALFASIADDETEHAELAWDLHAAFLELLEPTEREEVERGLSRALSALDSSLEPQRPSELYESLGLPGAQLSRALRARLVETLRAA